MRCNYLIVTKLLSQKCHSRGGLSATDVCSSRFPKLCSCKFKAAAGSLLDESRLPGSQTDGSLCLQVAEGEGMLWGLVCQSSDPIYEDKVLSHITPQVPSHWGLGFKVRTVGWEGPQAL